MGVGDSAAVCGWPLSRGPGTRGTDRADPEGSALGVLRPGDVPVAEAFERFHGRGAGVEGLDDVAGLHVVEEPGGVRREQPDAAVRDVDLAHRAPGRFQGLVDVHAGAWSAGWRTPPSGAGSSPCPRVSARCCRR